MTNVTKIEKTLSIREQAEQEVLKEAGEKAKVAMKSLLKQRLAAVAVVNGIDQQLADLEQQIADGTF
jgi:hypothetical protein